MSHHVYTTEAFIIESFAEGESNKYIRFFTKDLGMVGAKAQGVRSYKSKLRYGLEDFSLSTVSFVRGKTGWRVTGAVSQKNLYNDFSHEREKFLICAEVFNLIKKLVAGEEKNQELFFMITDAFEFLKREKLTQQDLGNFECLLVLRIVGNLGYLAHSIATKDFIENTDWSVGVVRRVSPVKRTAIKLINQSFTESGLY